MMSQNRESKKESLKSTNDFKTNIKSELILEKLYDKMEIILKNQETILNNINTKEQINNNEKIINNKENN